MSAPTAHIALVDAAEIGIAETLEALELGSVTSVDLVCAFLNRIAYFDRTGICLNAVPVLNPNVLDEARASDARRRAGETARPLEGVPFTVKDSYMVAGLTVACGSPAFEGLVASEDAATVAQLRAAGAVLIGKTNMPPMAAGGVQPGAYGYARSPYHPGYLTAAYGSGSSHGAAAATAASFCVFGLAEETLSSGRSPASNSALVAYTPSRGLISIRGNWPLFPTCDVVVPYARSMDDLLRLLDILVVDDERTAGDFWREQKAVDLPSVESVRPESFLRRGRHDLVGLRLGVPRMFIGDDPHKVNPVAIRPSIRALWDRAAGDLVRLGAELVPVDFPVVSNYELDRPEARNLVERGLVHEWWGENDPAFLIAIAWDEFLRRNGMPGLSGLADADGDRIFPDSPELVYGNAGVAFNYPALVELAKLGLPKAEDLPGFEESLRGLEQARVEDFERWLAGLGLDAVVFPANGDVASSSLFERPEHMDAALRNGVVFSNGNLAIRRLGIPTLTLPMGRMADISMPVGLTFAAPAYADELLLDIGAVYEQATRRRVRPPMTPSLPSSICLGGAATENAISESGPGLAVLLDVNAEQAHDGWLLSMDVEIEGGERQGCTVQAWVDGRSITVSGGDAGTWSASGTVSSALARLDDRALVLVKAAVPGLAPAAHWKLVALPGKVESLR
jgi:amidase